ncbi:NUDIX hydrolase [Pedobacter zeae]|uniref:GDP-mannose pyrophosphatase n=1 Tax=Pedobacter zeae TaxID=1737356 RepID=A0A7W6P769_9SPHI|nr:NUDIX hydrolase [Pedobacter zeae]MBB4108696.1 8-oxo-dGTP pyrophosphatase MutT (NUDIX family) [Pedobacter zeae]GGH07789.1 NUDIX hydrolase [Pedobacter zeae]
MMIEKWQKLASKYLVREKWATLRVDEVKLPDGIVKDDYYVLEYPNWVNAIALTAEGKMIMVRQYRHAADIVSLEVPGGVIDGDETPEFAVKRELLEETGYSFETCKFIAELYPNPATSNNRTFTYFLTGGVKTHNQQLDEHEILNVEEYTVEEVRQLIGDNKIAQALHVAALWYGLAEIEKL